MPVTLCALPVTQGFNKHHVNILALRAVLLAGLRQACRSLGHLRGLNKSIRYVTHDTSNMRVLTVLRHGSVQQRECWQRQPHDVH